MYVCVFRDLVKNGVVCPGADAELAALHPRRLLFAVSEMRTADPQLRRRPQQPGKMRHRDTESSMRGEKSAQELMTAAIFGSYYVLFIVLNLGNFIIITIGY